jgi:hypothetical protein
MLQIKKTLIDIFEFFVGKFPFSQNESLLSASEEKPKTINWAAVEITDLNGILSNNMAQETMI